MSGNHIVFARTFVILLLTSPPIPGQTVSTTSRQTSEQDLSSQTTEAGGMHPLQEAWHHSSEATSPTLVKAFRSSLAQSPAVETTSEPGLGSTSPPPDSLTMVPSSEETSEAGGSSAAAAQETEVVTTEGVSTESTTPPESSTPRPSSTATQFIEKTERSTTENASEIITATSATHLAPSETTSPTFPPTHSQTTDPAKTSSTLSTMKSTTAMPSRSKSWILIVIFVVFTALVTMALIIIVCVNMRKKKRSQTFGSSLRNGGSHKGKKKKGTGSDAWAGPVALNGDKDWEAAAEDGRKGEEMLKEGDEVEVVLSTFTAQDKEDIKADAEEDSKAKDVPLLSSARDVGEELPPPEPIGGGEGEEDEGETFCLTSAV